MGKFKPSPAVKALRALRKGGLRVSNGSVILPAVGKWANAKALAEQGIALVVAPQVGSGGAGRKQPASQLAYKPKKRKPWLALELPTKRERAAERKQTVSYTLEPGLTTWPAVPPGLHAPARVAAARPAVPTVAEFDSRAAALSPAAAAELATVRSVLAAHLGSDAAARLWLVIPDTGFEKPALEMIRDGRGDVVLDVLADSLGPSPAYA